jgi:hypothetical protein
LMSSSILADGYVWSDPSSISIYSILILCGQWHDLGRNTGGPASIRVEHFHQPLRDLSQLRHLAARLWRYHRGAIHRCLRPVSHIPAC